MANHRRTVHVGQHLDRKPGDLVERTPHRTGIVGLVAQLTRRLERHPGGVLAGDGLEPQARKRSLGKRVPVVSSNSIRLSHWLTCGVIKKRSRWVPRSTTSPSFTTRGSRSEKSR